MHQLSQEQKEVIRAVSIDFEKNQLFTIGGYAGTGKTTILRVLLEVLARKGVSFATCAYTGKATNVLRKKGIASASTIHSTIYQPYKNEDNETVWSLATKTDLTSRGIQGFLVDEASMVSKEIHDDLMSYNLPVIYVGDHGQLEPIGTKFNIMQSPMYKLETVHRNAGEIAHFAEHLRKGLNATDFPCQDKVQVVRNSAVEDRHLSSVDQVVCAFNRTRVNLNARVRKEKGIQYTFLAIGEKVICLRNKKVEGLFNGMQGVVTKIYKGDRFDFTSGENQYAYIKYDHAQFGRETNEFDFSQEANPFDYAYAITAHKSQGDEFGSVIAYEQRCDKWDHIRWSYTVASRAKNSLVWVAYESHNRI